MTLKLYSFQSKWAQLCQERKLPMVQHSLLKCQVATPREAIPNLKLTQKLKRRQKKRVKTRSKINKKRKIQRKYQLINLMLLILNLPLNKSPKKIWKTKWKMKRKLRPKKSKRRKKPCKNLTFSTKVKYWPTHSILSHRNLRHLKSLKLQSKSQRKQIPKRTKSNPRNKTKQNPRNKSFQNRIKCKFNLLKTKNLTSLPTSKKLKRWWRTKT